MANYRPIKDITNSNAKLLEEVDPELVVFNVDHTKSYVPFPKEQQSKIIATNVKDQMVKKNLSIAFGTDVLENSGWGSGTRLPFANKDNQELEKILEIRQRKYLAIQSELRDNREHLHLLEENFTRATEDIRSHQNFLASKKKQIEDEKNLLGLAERFQSKIVQEKNTTDKTLRACVERCDRMRSNTKKRIKNLAELRDLIEFDREALKEYHERLRMYQNQKLEMGRIIDDDAKTVEQIDNLYVELGAKRKVLKMELDMQAMTTQKCQEQLDRLSMEFRKVYKHRVEMIQLWSTNIENAKRKDIMMTDVSDDYFEVRERMRELTSETEFREKQFKQVQCSIRNTQFHISELDQKVAEIRRVVQEEKDEGMQFQDGIRDLQQEIRASSMEQRAFNARSAKLDAELAGLEGKLEKVLATVEKLRSRLRDVSDLRNTSDSCINEMEKILLEEEKKTEIVMREIELQRKVFWERSNDKKTIMFDMTQLDTLMMRVRFNLSNLEAKEFANMEFLAKQSAKVYRMDLECSALENRISKTQNESVNPQYFEMQATVAEMKKAMRKMTEEKKYVMKQLAFLEHLCAKNNAEVIKNKQDKAKLNIELLEINMVSQRTQKMMTSAEKEFQELQIENSLEVVNLRRLGDAVKLARDRMFTLSEQRQTVHYAVNERKTEIENNRALNQSKLKALGEATIKLKVQVQEMEGRTAKLRGRFDLITKMMMDTKRAGADEETVAQRIKRAARERESLQFEVKKWETRVEEAKQELVGLQNVLKLLHASNMSVKDKLSPIEPNSSDAQELEILDQEEKAIHVRKSRALKFKSMLFDKIEGLKQQMAVMEQETQATGQLCKMKTAMANRTDNELLKQREKVDRWSTICIKLLKEIKPLLNEELYDILQQDLKLKLTREKLECAFTMLERLLTTFPHLKDHIYHEFERNDHLQKHAHRILRAGSSKSTQQLTRAPTSSIAISREQQHSISQTVRSTLPGSTIDETKKNTKDAEDEDDETLGRNITLLDEDDDAFYDDEEEEEEGEEEEEQEAPEKEIVLFVPPPTSFKEEED